VATAVYRAVEEALANVDRHAQARDVLVLIDRADGYLTVAVEDNGVGFEPADAHQHGGVGLIGIRERIESVGGRLSVESGPAGTGIYIQVPLGDERSYPWVSHPRHNLPPCRSAY
jgi:two-component system, NarL family, sensor kinase